MAIQCKIKTIQGVDLETAYINIQNPQIIKTRVEDSNNYSFCGNVCVYANQEAYNLNLIPLEVFDIECALNIDQNIIVQGYEELKLNTRLENITEV